MRSLLLASGFATLGLADLAWLDLRLAPDILGRESVAGAPAAPPRAPLALATPPRPAVATSPKSLPPVPPKLVLQYDVDAREPTDVAKHEEDVAFALLSADPTLVVIIDGHTDRTGWTTYNERLSRTRADAIAATLTASGVPRSRISVSAHGARRPIAQGDDAASLARNRRVELSFERRSP